MALTAVFFDLDNTLIDYTGYKLRTAIASSLELVRMGFPDTVENLVRRIFRIYKEKTMEYQKTLADVVKQYNLPVSDAERYQQAALIEYNRNKFAGILPYPESLDVLRRLRGMGLKLAIVTDGPMNKAWQRLLLARLDHEFDAVITRDDTGKSKPHSAPFRLALARVGTIAKETMMVGDSIGKDMLGAQRIGIKACHAVYGDIDRKRNERSGGMVKAERRRILVVPDYTITRLKKLPPLVEKLR